MYHTHSSTCAKCRAVSLWQCHFHPYVFSWDGLGGGYQHSPPTLCQASITDHGLLVNNNNLQLHQAQSCFNVTYNLLYWDNRKYTIYIILISLWCYTCSFWNKVNLLKSYVHQLKPAILYILFQICCFVPVDPHKYYICLAIHHLLTIQYNSNNSTHHNLTVKWRQLGS